MAQDNAIDIQNLVAQLEKQAATIETLVAEVAKLKAGNTQPIVTNAQKVKAKGNSVSVKTDDGKVYEFVFTEGVVKNNQFRDPQDPKKVISLDDLMASQDRLQVLLQQYLETPNARILTHTITPK